MISGVTLAACALLAADGLLVAVLVVRARAGRRAIAVALLGMISLALTSAAFGMPAFEQHRRRAVYIVSREAGAWLDRTVHLGFTACAFAIAAALLAMDTADRTRPRTLLATLALTASIAAFAAAAYVHVRAPDAVLPRL